MKLMFARSTQGRKTESVFTWLALNCTCSPSFPSIASDSSSSFSLIYISSLSLEIMSNSNSCFLHRNGQFYYVGGSKNVHGVVRADKNMANDIELHEQTRYGFFREMMTSWMHTEALLTPLQRKFVPQTFLPLILSFFFSIPSF